MQVLDIVIKVTLIGVGALVSVFFSLILSGQNTLKQQIKDVKEEAKIGREKLYGKLDNIFKDEINPLKKTVNRLEGQHRINHPGQ